MNLDQNLLNSLSQNFRDTLSSDVKIRHLAEASIDRIKSHPQFALLLLSLIAKADIDKNVCLSASIAFKNYVKLCWNNESDYQIPDPDCVLIKERIIDLIAIVPDNVQKQICESISFIGKNDFPSKWQTLLSQIIEKFQTGDFKVINGVLQIAQSIFNRYCHEFKSTELWQEIKYVLANFASPLSQLFKATSALLTQYKNEPKALDTIIHSLTLMADIFYSLNYQDLPEYFEDNMDLWMQEFLGLITFECDLLENKDDDTPSKLDLLKAKICNIAMLYSEKYDEEFTKFLQPFFDKMWNLVIKLDSNPKNDTLVIAGIESMETIVRKKGNLDDLIPSRATTVEGDGAPTAPSYTTFCQNIFSSLIVPNIVIRDTDIENFHDNPFEYIRFDLETSESGTRRKACATMVKTLKKKFSTEITQREFVSNFIGFSQSLIANYRANSIANWKYKDLAMLLYICIYSPPASGQNVSTFIAQYTDLLQFYESQILPEIVEGPGVAKELAIVKSDCLKFLIVYRVLLAALNPNLYLNCCRQIISQFLGQEYPVIHSYSAIILERSLVPIPKAYVQIIGLNYLVNPDSLKDILPVIIDNIFKSLQYSQSKENQYLMKALMRVLITFKDSFGTDSTGLVSLTPVISKLIEILARISKNPTNPYFNHYLFESLCLCVHYSEFSAFQKQFLATVDEICKNEVQEFVPYVFQILASLVESPQFRTELPLFDIIFPYATTPSLWDKPGNVPALVRLLIALLYKFNAVISKNPKNMDTLLGVVQKLIMSKANDHEGFRLLKGINHYMDKNITEKYHKPTFFLLFQRLQLAKTLKYSKDLVLYISFFVNEFGPSKLFSVLETIQPKMFFMVMEKIFLPNLNLIQKKEDKLACCVSLIKILTECQEFDLNQHPDLWSSLFENLVSLIENQQIAVKPVQEQDDFGQESMILLDAPDDEYSASFSQLNTLSDTPGYLQSLYPDLASPKHRLSTNLKTLFSTLTPDKVTAMQKSFDNKTINLISNYINS